VHGIGDRLEPGMFEYPRAAVAGQIDRDRMLVIGQSRHDGVPHQAVERKAMQKQERLPADSAAVALATGEIAPADPRRAGHLLPVRRVDGSRGRSIELHVWVTPHTRFRNGVPL
jgi:hypothetical protein